MKRELSFLLAAAMAASLAGCAADIADADSSITALNDSATAELTSYNAADAVTLTFTDSPPTVSAPNCPTMPIPSRMTPPPRRKAKSKMHRRVYPIWTVKRQPSSPR